MEELGLGWSLPEEPTHSHLDEWFLLGHSQAPRQQASPFFPEVHNETTRSWHGPYTAILCASSSSTLMTVEGAEEKGFHLWPCLALELRVSPKPLPLHRSHPRQCNTSCQCAVVNMGPVLIVSTQPSTVIARKIKQTFSNVGIIK